DRPDQVLHAQPVLLREVTQRGRPAQAAEAETGEGGLDRGHGAPRVSGLATGCTDRCASQGWKPPQGAASIAPTRPAEGRIRGQDLDWTKLIFDLIDLRSFSNLWYWIALAVTWSSASHWVLGIPYDMVLRARRTGGQAEADLEDIARINVSRILYIVREAGVILLAMLAFVLTTLALLGFVYKVEFAQAVFLIAAPLTVVGLMSVTTARRIVEEGDRGE